MAANTAYFDSVAAHYGAAFMAPLHPENVSYVALDPYDDVAGGNTLPFATIGERGPDMQPLLYVPGFGEGIINKISFAAELALQGQQVILPGQNRTGMLRDQYEAADPIGSQASNYNMLIERMTGRNSRPHIIAHSFGALITERMVQDRPDLYADSRVVLLAPAGMVAKETYSSLARRWVAMLRSESDHSRPTQFPDIQGTTGKASMKVLSQNVSRTFAELGALRHAKLDAATLAGHVAALDIITYAEDAMYPQELLAPQIMEAVAAGTRWMSPTDIASVATGQMEYGGHGAVHDDEQFNPRRVAGAVIQALYPRWSPIRLEQSAH